MTQRSQLMLDDDDKKFINEMIVLFKYKLDLIFSKDAFHNIPLLKEAFSNIESLLNEKNDKLKSSELEAQIEKMEDDLNNLYYDTNRFKQTLNKDFKITNDEIEKLKLNTTDILKSEAILFTILTPIKSDIFNHYITDDVVDEKYKIVISNVMDKVKDKVLNKISLAKNYDPVKYQLLENKKLELDKLISDLEATNSVIYTSENKFISEKLLKLARLKSIDNPSDLHRELIILSPKSELSSELFQEISNENTEEQKKPDIDITINYLGKLIEDQKSEINNYINNNLDKIHISLIQNELERKMRALQNHYTQLADSENEKPQSNEIVERKNEIEKIKKEIDDLKGKFNAVVEIIKLSLIQPDVDIMIPDEYKEYISNNDVSVQYNSYNMSYTKAKQAITEQLKIKIDFLTITEQSADFLMKKSISYDNKNVNVNAILITAYLDAVNSYKESNPDETLDDLKEKFGTVFHNKFGKYLFTNNKEIAITDVEKMEIFNQYPTHKFVELYNETFNSLSSESKRWVNILKKNTFINAQAKLADELKKIKINNPSMDMIVVEDKPYQLKADYQKLIIVKTHDPIDLDKHIQLLHQANNQANQAISLAVQAKDALVNDIKITREKQHEDIIKRDIKYVEEEYVGEERNNIFEKLTKAPLAKIINDGDLEEMANQDELSNRFRNIIRNKIDPSSNSEFNKQLTELYEFLIDVKSKNERQSMRVPLYTLYSEISLNLEFRKTLEDKKIKNEIQQFIQNTNKFTVLPEIEKIVSKQAHEAASVINKNNIKSVEKKPFKSNDSYTSAEIVFIIVSLGMYAYLRNCVGMNTKLSTPSNIVKIALAVIIPPVAMITGIFSLFCPPLRVSEELKNNKKSQDRK